MLYSSQGKSLTIWKIILTTIVTLIVALRFEAARIKRRTLRLDDYFLLVAYVCMLTLESLSVWGIVNGLGAHTKDLNEDELVVQMKMFLGTGIAWLVSSVFCKLSILYLYIRIFTTKPFRIAAQTLVFVVSVYGFSFLCVFLTECRPISYSWSLEPGTHCKSITVEEIVSVSMNMVIDTSIIILPMPPLWGLQMATRRKVVVSGLFSLGLLVVALMGWRIKITVESMSKTDFVYGLGNIALVADLEVWLGITVACLPTLTPLFGKYIKPVMSKMAGISRKHTAQEPLKQALHSVGSSEARRPRNKQFSRLDTDSLLELGEGNKFGQVETTVKSPNATRREGRDLKSDLNNIVVRHDIRVYGEPHK